ncbi:MAG: FtsQ-type POTRA domain-containing protein [Nitrospiraceae bacterium]|nr:FtsQ-type POTRA domain-containing protein [Nitrospiraceae bacterium]
MRGRKNKNRKKTKMGGPGGPHFIAAGKALFLKAIISLALVVAACAALFGYMRSNGMFPLRKVVFEGNKNLSNGELLALLKVRAGQNMLELSRKDLSERLLASPWVQQAAVRKEILTGRIAVRVDERKPFVIIRRDGVMWLADIQGRLLEPMRAGVAPFLPVIDSDVKDYPDTFREAVLLARCLRDRGYFQRPIQIMAACPPEDLSMQSADEVVRVGFGDYGQKLNMLAELESEIAKRQIKASVIDLRFANRVIVTPVVAQAVKGASAQPTSVPSGEGMKGWVKGRAG